MIKISLKRNGLTKNMVGAQETTKKVGIHNQWRFASEP